MKILILASNPRKDLDLDEEIRILRSVIDRSRDRDHFEVVSEPGVRVGDLHRLLPRHKPEIVHFCGHGGGKEGLIFKLEGGGEQRVRADALADMFGLNPICSHVKCVLLNACYSEEQANAIVSRIDYVVGMSHEIQDNAAIAFSKGFYLALGEGCSIDDSFEFGRNAIQLEISGSSKMRSAATEQQRKAQVIDAVTTTVIPEHLKPILKRNPRLSQNADRVISSSQQPLSQSQREEIQLDVAKALTEENPNRQQYREKVREFLADRRLTPGEKFELKQLAGELGISEQLQAEILQQEEHTIEVAKEQYKELVSEYVKDGYYPFSNETQDELKRLQDSLGLLDSEAAAISQPILETAEQERLEKLRQRYGQEFKKAIEAQYPIDSSVRDELRKFQQTLGLSDEEVAQIEEPLIAIEEADYQQQLEQQHEQERQQQRQRELNQQRELERQRQLEEQRRQEEARRNLQKPSVSDSKTSSTLQFQRFEFEVITVNDKGEETNRTREWAECFAESLGNGVTLEMVKIPGGTFQMGSPAGRGSDGERPQHSVKVSSFLMGKYPVTQAQWRIVAALPKVDRDLKPDPSNFKGNYRPVEQVSWYDAIEFCKRLSQRTGREYRLPSEAEWEYACRAGTKTDFYFGQKLTPKLAQCKSNFGMVLVTMFSGQTATVGSYFPNRFGLYDMHGNVWEWCADHWHGNYQGAPDDGSAWVAGGNSDYRLWRGGSWVNHPWFCRSASRYYSDPADRYGSLGFRVVCGLA